MMHRWPRYLALIVTARTTLKQPEGDAPSPKRQGNLTASMPGLARRLGAITLAQRSRFGQSVSSSRRRDPHHLDGSADHVGRAFSPRRPLSMVIAQAESMGHQRFVLADAS